MLTLRFADGTLTLDGLGDHAALLDGLVVFDGRVQRHRAKACAYAEILRRLHGKVEYADAAKKYAVLDVAERDARALRPYQTQAIDAWLAAK